MRSKSLNAYLDKPVRWYLRLSCIRTVLIIVTVLLVLQAVLQYAYLSNNVPIPWMIMIFPPYLWGTSIAVGILLAGACAYVSRRSAIYAILVIVISIVATAVSIYSMQYYFDVI